MSRPDEPDGPGRGAAKRRELRQRRRDREALRWWTKPGVLLFLGVFGLAALGWGLLIQAGRRIPVEEATVDGLETRLEQATWVIDQMEHGQGIQQPASMMPGMPEAGKQRVTVYLAVQNQAGDAREFHGEEFSLVPEIGDEVPPMGAVAGEAELAPGQTFNTALHFDIDTREPHGRLKMAWHRGRRSAYFPIPHPPEHYHLRPRGGDVALPQDARLLLPLADADRGGRLYAEVYGCSACHGDPKVPDSNNIGPHLGHIAAAAGSRISGMGAEQYIYQSILDPAAFVAPDCKGGPCETPSAMPEYSRLINLQDAADLLGYLLEQG